LIRPVGAERARRPILVGKAMTLRKPSRKVLRSLCAEVHPDDGIDPRELARRGGPRGKPRRKVEQLCRQVAETLDSALAAERDDVLQGLQVVSVAPAPDASRLLVTVRAVAAPSAVDPGLVLDRLARASPRLRCEVAAAITRRKAPTLTYRLAVAADS
jgi:ribosome-binding factor A